MGTNSKTAHQSYPIGPASAVPITVPITGPVVTQAGGDDHEPAPAGVTAEPTGPALGSDPGGGPLIPVPDTPPEGVAAGTPVLIGGEDLIDSAATLISYTGPSGPREVLLATVTEQAEAKLLHALALSGHETVAVQVQQDITGRLPLDEKRQLHELVAAAAKSVNHKLKTGAEIPQATVDKYDKAAAAVQAVLDDPAATADEHAMAAHYRAHLDAVAARISGTVTASYADGGKVPTVTLYLHTGTATVTMHVPAPDSASEPGKLSATLRQAGRIQASIDPATGMSSWDGQARVRAKGKEYLVDLGDGFSAIYRPYQANDPTKHEFSLRGQLEVHAPPGAGNGQQLVRRLGQLNLVNRPMTAAEGEWTYLQANITAQNLASHPQVAQAVNAARAMEDLEVQEVFHARAHEAVGLDPPGLHALAREFQLDAAARCLPKKVAVVRDAVAAATGFASGAELAAHPGYDPVPRASGGWLTWSRFDVTGRPAEIAKAWSGRRLVHKVGGGANLTAMFATGVLASTERRAVMGVASGKGISESVDKRTGGANSVFLRVRDSPYVPGPALVWDDPAVLLRRADYYGYNSDHFGSLNPASGKSTAGLTRDPKVIAAFTSSTNEVMVGNGIDLLGAEAPSRIVCTTPAQRKELLALFATRGITHLRGRPVTQVVS